MALMERIKIGISSCLLGKNVRYDGCHQRDPYITDILGRYFEWAPVCPEVECGLGIPREAMHLVGNPLNTRLVTIRTYIDHTDGIMKWIEAKLRELEKEDLSGFIFKSKSPSSAIRDVEIYSLSGIPVYKGAGIFGGSFIKRFPLIPVIDDDHLHDPILRKVFIKKVFAYKKTSGF